MLPGQVFQLSVWKKLKLEISLLYVFFSEAWYTRSAWTSALYPQAKIRTSDRSQTSSDSSTCICCVKFPSSPSSNVRYWQGAERCEIRTPQILRLVPDFSTDQALCANVKARCWANSQKLQHVSGHSLFSFTKIAALLREDRGINRWIAAVPKFQRYPPPLGRLGAHLNAYLKILFLCLQQKNDGGSGAIVSVSSRHGNFVGRLRSTLPP